MNRPTKYRAWANGKMHDVRAISFTESGEVHRILDTEGVQRVPEALLQYIGRNDKNDEEIYEGHILEGNWQNDFGSFEPGLRGVIHCHADAAFQAGTLRGNGYPHCKIGKNVTVRGTIYENPELLAK
jgi:hypothetical protein